MEPATPFVADAPTSQWLLELKERAKRGDRPLDKAHGRWLGDFLDQDTACGLQTAEERLLQDVASGYLCKISDYDWHQQSDFEELQKGPCRLRADFIRFLALGGDENAPIHESGLLLHGGFIDGELVLLGTRVERLSLEKCYIDGGVLLQDSLVGVLHLAGSRLAGISGNRVKIAGSVFLNKDFVCDGPVSFHSAKIGGSLICVRGTINNKGGTALDCTGAKIIGDVLLESGFKCDGTVLLSAEIGSLICTNGKINNKGGGALICVGAKIVGHVFLEAFEADGRVSLVGANIGGDLYCNSGRFRPGKNDRAALDCAGAKVAGDVFLNDGFDAEGTVSFIRTEIKGSLYCGGSFKGKELTKEGVSKIFYGTALDGSRAIVGGDVVLSGEVRGEVRLISTQIAGQLDCAGGQFENPDGYSINAEDVRIERSLLFTNGFSAKGGVNLLGVRVTRDLCCSGSFKKDANGFAIGAQNARISGDAYFVYPFKAKGGVSLYGAQIDGTLECGGGRFTNPDGVALDCTISTIKGQARLTEFTTAPDQLAKQFHAKGEVCFHTARIGAHLDCAGGHFENPNGAALRCEATRIDGCVFLRRADPDDPSQPAPSAFEADGEVRFANASIGLQVDCHGGRFRTARAGPLDENIAGMALNLEGATIKDTLYLGVPAQLKHRRALLAYFRRSNQMPPKREPTLIEGTLSLEGASVRVLDDAAFIESLDMCLPKRIGGTRAQCHVVLDGFTYERIGGNSPGKARIRKRWLGRQPHAHLKHDFRPQPFEQLIKVLRAMGHGSDADRIALSKRWHLWKARSWRSPAKIPELVLVNGFLGYGYRLFRALAILFVIACGYSWFYALAAEQGAIVPAEQEVRERFEACRPPRGNLIDCAKSSNVRVPFNPWFYSADAMLPIVSLGQRTAWVPAPDRMIQLEFPLFGPYTMPPSGIYTMQVVQILIGWLCGLLLVSVVSGFIKKE